MASAMTSFFAVLSTLLLHFLSVYAQSTRNYGLSLVVSDHRWAASYGADIYFRVEGDRADLPVNARYTEWTARKFWQNNRTYEWTVNLKDVGNPVSLTVLNKQNSGLRIWGGGVDGLSFFWGYNINLRYRHDGLGCSFVIINLEPPGSVENRAATYAGENDECPLETETYRTYDLTLTTSTNRWSGSGNTDIWFRIEGDRTDLAGEDRFTEWDSNKFRSINTNYSWSTTLNNVGGPLSLTVLTQRSNSLIFTAAGVGTQSVNWGNNVKIKYGNGGFGCSYVIVNFTQGGFLDNFSTYRTGDGDICPFDYFVPTPAPTSNPTLSPLPKKLTLRQAAEQSNPPITIGTSVRYGNLVAPDAFPLYSAYVKDQFNTLTAEHYCKWEAIQPGPNSWDWSGCDFIYNYGLTHGMKMTFHTIVWDQNVPNWLRTGGYTSAQAEQFLRDYTEAVMTRYPGDTVYSWDIVNEAIKDVPTWPDDIYRDYFWYETVPNYIEIAFNVARNANPEPMLFYNDFNIIMTSTWMQAKADSVYNLLSGLIANGVPIDGIGFQCHLFLTHYDDIINSYDRVITNLERFAALGLEIHITEMDVDCGYWSEALQRRVPCDSWDEDSERKQAEIYALILRACLQVPACTSFELWGFTDAITWLYGHYPLIFDEQYVPKLAAFYILEELAPGAELSYGVNFTTPRPTTASPTGPTPEPTLRPTRGPTTPAQADEVVIKSHNTNNEWWMAFYVENVPAGVTVDKFEARDSNNDNVWHLGVLADWAHDGQVPFIVENLGRPVELPLDIRLTSNLGQVIVSQNLVTDINPWSEFPFGDSLDSN